MKKNNYKVINTIQVILSKILAEFLPVKINNEWFWTDMKKIYFLTVDTLNEIEVPTTIFENLSNLVKESSYVC